MDTGPEKPMALEWIDIAKGLGIVCVLIGHIIDGLPSTLVYTFHMPLFFFLGGFLHKVDNDTRRYLVSKTRHILIPYAAFLLVLYVPGAVLHVLDGHRNAVAWAKAIAIPLIGGRLLGGATSVFWFVTCFFLVQQLFNALAVRYPMRKVATIMLAMFVASFVNSMLVPGFWLPWNANVVLAAAPIYFAGHVFRRAKFDIPPLVLCLLVAAGLALLLAGFDNRYDMKKAAYGIPVVTFVSAMAIVLLVVRVSRALEGSLVGRCFARLGVASMAIMYLHQIVQIELAGWPAFAGEWTRLAATLVLCYLFYLVASRFALMRAVFLGSARDLKALR